MVAVNLRGIKELVDSGLHHVPTNYIRPPHDRPSLTAHPPSQQTIPVVDLASLLGDGRKTVIEEIGRACSEWGFFQVINHGVPEAVRDRMWKAVEEFFDLPAEERMRLYSENILEPVSYMISFNRPKESVLEWKDSLFLRRTPEIKFDGFKQAPEFFREPAIQFLDQAGVLAAKLCDAIFESLGMDAESRGKELPKMAREVMAVNYYPPCPDPSLAFGISAHSDIGMLTILMPDEVPGLQVRKGDEWVAVEAVPGSFIVNLADQIQILTNGKYKSVEHRAVTNSDKKRMSIPCFFQPGEEALVGPLARFVNDENPAQYKEITYGDYVKCFYSRALDSKTNLNLSKA